jgi:uncharacterized protein
MEAIYIPQLTKAPNQTERVEIQDYLPGLETLTPVQGSMRVTHRGNYLEVAAQAEAIATLTCDRCLKQYNHRLKVDTTELIWLQEPDSDVDTDREVPFDEFVETLPPTGYFRPSEWLYEQLCLEIPQQQLCDAECGGIATESEAPTTPIDRRWSSLEALRQQLSN